MIDPAPSPPPPRLKGFSRLFFDLSSHKGRKIEPPWRADVGRACVFLLSGLLTCSLRWSRVPPNLRAVTVSIRLREDENEVE